MPKLTDALQSGLQLAVATGANLAITAIAARGLGPDRMGTYGILLFAQSVAVLLSSAGWAGATTRFMAEAAGRRDTAGATAILAEARARTTRRAVLLAAAAAVVAIALGTPSQASALPLAIGIPIQAALAIQVAAAQALGRFGATAAATILAAPVSVGGAWLATTWGAGPPGLLTALAAATLVQATALAALTGLASTPSRRKLRERRHLARLMEERWRSAGLEEHSAARPPALAAGGVARYAHSVELMAILDSVVWQRSELLILGLFSPASAAAHYHLAHGLAGTATKVPGALVPLLIPAMARAETRQGLADQYRQATRQMAFLAIPTATGAILLASPLVTVLFGPGYDAVAPLLCILAIANAAVMVLGYPASSVLYAAGGEQVIVRVGIAIAALNIALGLVLVPAFGALGAVAANSLAQLASLGPGMALAFARMPGRPRPKDFAFPLAASAAMILPVQAAQGALPGLPGLLAAAAAGAATYAGLWLIIRACHARATRFWSAPTSAPPKAPKAHASPKGPRSST